MDDEALKKAEEKFKEKAEELAEGARKLGLYVEDVGLGLAPPEPGEESPSPVLVVNFAVGDAAWSDRIHAPEEDQIQGQVAQMEHQLGTQEFEALRERLARGEIFKEEEGE